MVANPFLVPETFFISSRFPPFLLWHQFPAAAGRREAGTPCLSVSSEPSPAAKRASTPRRSQEECD